ncbi:hypothetical protein PFISCL1PPCAC_19159 [Pristionchus fissidentatus]|uniref:Uncharacterized protein n=1 Tax=Pristionchus fissidentatus TaxID=1538716 RepID=A0AAV5W7Q8_9BILA|nr:hypothetical protein PFISCL1PPCAC_19159 [Pristionchus fissidentatus]
MTLQEPVSCDIKLCDIKARAFCPKEDQIKDDSDLLATLKNKNTVIFISAIDGITTEGLFILYQKIRHGEVDAKRVNLITTEKVWGGFLNLASEDKFQKRLIVSFPASGYICLLNGNFELHWSTKDSRNNQGGRNVAISLYDDEKKWEQRKNELFGENSIYVVDQTDNVDLKGSDR